MKITADTNVLLRAVLDDDLAQQQAAIEALERADLVAVSLQSLCEFAWVLARSYQTARADIASALRAVIAMRNVVVNRPAAGVTFNSARIRGEVTDTGGETPTVVIYWGDDDAGTIDTNWDNQIPLGTKGPETFGSDITGLVAGRIYYFRCHAENSVGGAWAPSTASFTTRAEPSGPSGGTGFGCTGGKAYALGMVLAASLALAALWGFLRATFVKRGDG